MNYEIKGTPLPVVICNVEANECMISERGSMAWMTPNMKMETTSNGGIGKALGRAFSGEAMFQNRYTAQDGPGLIAFASSFPGQIMPIQIRPGFSIIAQKSAFMAAESSVELSVFFRKKLGASLFGGEGFIMQKISGNGTAFLEIDGSVVDYTLATGESLLIDTGYLAFMEETVGFDIQSVPGMKNAVFGGEGLFNTRVTGPGKIWLQTMPATSIAQSLAPLMVSKQ